MKNFKELKIWQKGFDIAIKSFRLTCSFPANEKFGICSQVTKSAVSIPFNIAEGSSRMSEKDSCRFIEISLGSTFELETQLLIDKAVNFGSAELTAEILKEVDEEEKMLMSFIKRLNK